ncbi:hypothetical protein Tco_0792374 [Tanacetum coccineum]
MVVQNQAELGKGSVIPTDPHHTPTITQPSTSKPQKTQKPRKPTRHNTQVPQSSDSTEIVIDEAVRKELGDSLVRAATTVSSLEVEEDSGNINTTQSKATHNESTSSGGLGCQEAIGDTIAQTRRVKKLEQKKRSRTHRLKRLHKVGMSRRVESSGDEEDLGEDASKQGRRINAINDDDEITLVNVQDDADNEIFNVDTLTGDGCLQNKKLLLEVVRSTVATTVTITTEEITLAQALEALKTSKPKVQGIVFQELGKSTTTTTTTKFSSQQSQAKGKGIMIEEPIKSIKKKDLIRLGEEAALKLQAKFKEEERLAKEKAKKEKEANIALTET